MSSLPVFIFDFDGTVSLGDGPVLAYARAIAEQLAEGAELLSEVELGLAGELGEVIDGYDLVRQAALRRGATEAQLSAAYLASREALASDAAPVVAPAGLAEFLAGARAERILLTNAPAIRIDEALASLGLTGLFDRVLTNARKPGGLIALLNEFDDTRQVLSIGDVWGNDLAPAHERGFATAHVGVQATSGVATQPASFVGASVTEVLSEMTIWLEQAAARAAAQAH